MASKPLSKGQQNFTQLAIACVEEITQVFKDTFETQIKPKDLYSAIIKCSKLTNGKDKLNQYQHKICCIFPPQVPDYNKFDVSLFYKLMRNLCPSLEPTTGWGNAPNTSDLQIGDDIERLRIFRNEMFAHLESSEVPDGIFSQCWKELKGCIHRAQSFMDSHGYCVNYDEELKNIEKLDLSCKDMDKYKLFLEEIMIMWKFSQNIDVPVITITGNSNILCGDRTCFEAKTDKCPSSNNWPISWERVNGSEKKIINTSTKRYKGSTSRRLVIQRVVKKDEGEYRAVISRELNGSHFTVTSNMLFLNALGDLPNLEIFQATSGMDDVTILYHCDIEKTSPVIEKIEWIKDGEPLSMKANKYKGGGVTDRYLKILSPSAIDSGEYKCRVFNAVGKRMKRIVLATPSVAICKELTVPLGGQVTITPEIQSCPSPEKAIWQKSKTQTPEEFLTIDIDDARYSGSSLDPEKPILVISKASNADNLYYRLEITNGIGKSTSNAVLLKLVGDVPSVFANLETNIADRSVTFHCKISLSINYPEVTEIIWIKDREYIDTSTSGGKFAGGSIADPSLVVHSVNSKDTGEYQCRVSNAVGSMLSKPIHLGKPMVQIGRPERDEKNDILVCKAAITSIPEATKAEWRIQQSKEDDFQPIDVHDANYRGSTVSLPHPVLIVRGYSNKQGQRFQISVSNFVGETREVILDKRMKFYRKGGSKIPFASLKDDLDSSFPNKKLKRLKQLLIGK
ncbi:hemicentin-2-like [Saccostrea cucullata]|uniref:hemicentin-2-like n=1 Tax=Saccostrea cuccullata TaxID=36930 RepID=UPI002ED632DE